MRLIKGKKRGKCKACPALILSDDWKYKATEGYYCHKCGKFIKLHQSSLKWIKSVARLING